MESTAQDCGERLQKFFVAVIILFDKQKKIKLSEVCQTQILLPVKISKIHNHVLCRCVLCSHLLLSSKKVKSPP